jgi:hypothetical protein
MKKLRRVYTEEQRERALLLHKEGKTYRWIEDVVGVSKGALEWWIKHPNKPLNRVWTGLELEFLKEYYPTAKREFLLEALPDWSWEQIVSGAGNHGIRRKRVYSKSILDFSIIDTQEKAYFVGFAAADGCIVKSKEYEDYYRFIISLSIVDYAFLEGLKNLIYPDSKLREEEKGKMVRFSIGDVVFCKQLMKHGIVPQKTHIVGPPEKLPVALIPHYIRGYFDGDGCAYIDKRNYLHCSLVGSKKIIMFIHNEFHDIYKNSCKVRKTRNSFVISYGAHTGIEFAAYIYKDATIYLERKYQIVKPYLEREREN